MQEPDLAGGERGAAKLSHSKLLGTWGRTAYNTSDIGAWVGSGQFGKSWCTGEGLTTGSL